MQRIEKITVVGAGLMGHGIAQVAAQFGGFKVYMVDVKNEFLERGMKMIKESLGKFVEKGKLTDRDAERVTGMITPSLNLEQSVSDSDFVIEAATEEVNVKLELFKRISESSKEDTVITSNTSSISITLLSSVTKKPEMVAGMHFFNPPQLMPLVEIVMGMKTSEQTVEVVKEVARRMEKETVLCKKDSPGFIVNRILVPALNEAVFLVEEGVAEPEEIDKAIKLGLNWPMGPLQLLDYVGLDTTLNITQVFMNEFQDSKYRPANLLRRMVRAGLLGRKTGKGFYSWESPALTKRKDT
jgi:3-hydroxybutyryl-CoA dehydrogenase